jgi:hypothetical protein
VRYCVLEKEGNHMSVQLTNRRDHDRKRLLPNSTSYVRKLIEDVHPVNELFNSDTVTLEKVDEETPLCAARRVSKCLQLKQPHAILWEANERADVPAVVTLANICRSPVFFIGPRIWSRGSYPPKAARLNNTRAKH